MREDRERDGHMGRGSGMERGSTTCDAFHSPIPTHHF